LPAELRKQVLHNFLEKELSALCVNPSCQGRIISCSKKDGENALMKRGGKREDSISGRENYAKHTQS